MATSNGYTRPQLADDTHFDVSHGRHPVIDCILSAKGDTFVTNSCNFASSPLAIITGPNMGGKSTFLRQNALLAIMAQSGSFVPAQRAAIGIVDAVFTRIGAADDLARDRSTFMLEMEETASILRHATPRSLIIMDEVGRGTAADEGLALAIGIAKKIHRIGCRCLFATHYTQLPQHLLLDENDSTASSRVQCWRTSVTEDGEGGIVVIPRIVPGISEQSFAIPIARLAGIVIAISASRHSRGSPVRSCKTTRIHPKQAQINALWGHIVSFFCFIVLASRRQPVGCPLSASNNI